MITIKHDRCKYISENPGAFKFLCEAFVENQPFYNENEDCRIIVGRMDRRGAIRIVIEQDYREISGHELHTKSFATMQEAICFLQGFRFAKLGW